jgi:hypothetical protein
MDILEKTPISGEGRGSFSRCHLGENVIEKKRKNMKKGKKEVRSARIEDEKG